MAFCSVLRSAQQIFETWKTAITLSISAPDVRAKTVTSSTGSKPIFPRIVAWSGIRQKEGDCRGAAMANHRTSPIPPDADGKRHDVDEGFLAAKVMWKIINPKHSQIAYASPCASDFSKRCRAGAHRSVR